MNEYYQVYSYLIYVSILSLVCLYCFFYYERENVEPELLNERPVTYPALLNQYTETCFTKEGDCIICLEEYGDKEIRILKCFHSFHKDCIDKWIETSKKMECPICSYNIL